MPRRITPEEQKACTTEVNQKALPFLKELVRDLKDEKDNGYGLQPDPLTVSKYMHHKTQLTQIWHAAHNVRGLLLVETTEEENTMTNQIATVPTAAQAAEKTAEQLAAERALTHIKLPFKVVETDLNGQKTERELEIKRTSTLAIVWVELQNPKGVTIEEVGAKIKAAHPDRMESAIYGNIRVEISRLRKSFGVTVGRNGEGRYSVAFTESTRGRAVTPEELEKAKIAATEKLKAISAKSDETVRKAQERAAKSAAKAQAAVEYAKAVKEAVESGKPLPKKPSVRRAGVVIVPSTPVTPTPAPAQTAPAAAPAAPASPPKAAPTAQAPAPQPKQADKGNSKGKK